MAVRPIGVVLLFMLCFRLVQGFKASPLRKQARVVSARFSTTDNAQQKKAKNTGGLRRLPVVKSPVELMNKAKREAERVKADT